MFTTEYLIVCLLSLGVMLYTIFKVLRNESNDGGDGGLENDFVPIPDLPGGSGRIDETKEEQESVLEDMTV